MNSDRVLPAVIGLCSPCMGSGKTTIADELADRYGFKIVRFAGVLKAMIRTLFEETGLPPATALQLVYDAEMKETPLPLLGGQTPRHAMQTLGSEWGRDLIHPELWVNATMGMVRTLREQGHPVVLDDLRFPNEARAVEDVGGCVIRIIRPDARITQAHASEGGLDSWNVFATVMNDGGFEGVPDRADQLMMTLTEPRRQ